MFISNLRNLLVGMLAALTMDIPTAASVNLRILAPLPPRCMGR